MHLYDESTSRQDIWRIRVNWLRELAFSERQTNFIKNNVPNERGVYCIYAKHYTFPYASSHWPTKRWSSVIYIGSGWLKERLYAHLTLKRNNLLAEYLEDYELAYRFDRINDDDEKLDWPKTVEASLLHHFGGQFGRVPLANRRREGIPALPIDKFIVNQSDNFNFLRG